MTFSPEQLNFFKFSSVVLDEFPIILRSVFASMWDNFVATTTTTPGVPKWDDSITVHNIFLTKEGGPKKALTLNKSYKEWDCTALFKATLFAQTFAMPDGTGGVCTLDRLYVKPLGLSAGAFHSSVRSATGNQAETYALALDQLRLLRNTLCHQISTREIDNASFAHYIWLAKNAFTALRQNTSRIDEIGKLAADDFPTVRFKQLEEDLKREKDAAITFKQIDDHLVKIESKVEVVVTDVKDINSGVTYVKTQVEDVRSDVKDVKTKMEDVGSDVKDINTGVTDVKTQVEDVRSDVKDVKTKMEDVGSDVKDINTGVTDVKTQVEDVRSDVKDVKTKMEDVGSDVKDINTGVTDVKTQVEDVRSDVKDVKTKMEDVGSDVKDVKTKMEDVGSDVKDVKTKMEDVGSDVKDISTGVTDVKTQVEDVRSDVKDVKTKMEDVWSDVKGVRTGVTDVKTQVKDVTTGITDMKTQVEDVGSDVKELKTDFDHIKQAMQGESLKGKISFFFFLGPSRRMLLFFATFACNAH